MTSPADRTGWAVLAGIVLVALGAWMLVAPLLGGLLHPVVVVLGMLARIAWPLVLSGIGVLLIIRARGGGFTVNGKKLYRSRNQRMLAGVLGGAAEYLNVDVTLVRIAYALFTLVTAVWLGVLLYIAAMIIVPEQDAAPAGSTWGQQPWEGQQAANVAAPPPPAPPVPGPPPAAPEPPAAPAAPEPPAAPVAPEPPVAPTETP
jgi:phage shock protein C